VNPSFRVVVVAAIAVVALDTLGSLAARAFGFGYGSLAWGSFIIYAVAGFCAARSSTLRTAAQAGGAVALVDATLGWAIAWALGPGRPTAGYIGIGPLLGTVGLAWLIGIALGLMGGLVARFFTRGPNVAG